jgi:broad specificity phosphatase PhoE
VKAPARVILVRHGRTEWNATHRFQGQQDIPLDAEGIAQAEAVGTWLSTFPIEAVYSSDLSRAAETAQTIARHHGVAVRTEVRLREIHYGAFEGLTALEILDRLPAEGRAWWSDRVTGRPPAGESIPELRRRVTQWWDATVPGHGGQTIVVVGHGGSLQPLIEHALGSPEERSFKLPFGNTGVSSVSWQGPGSGCLEFHNLHCHLDS